MDTKRKRAREKEKEIEREREKETHKRDAVRQKDLTRNFAFHVCHLVDRCRKLKSSEKWIAKCKRGKRLSSK